jgi:hypothetical protein
MELKQQKRKQWDKLWLEDGRIHHEWNLSRERGSRSTLVENLDSRIGFQVTLSEGKLPYLVLAAITAVLMFLCTKGDGIGPIVWGMLPTLFVLFLCLALRIKSKEELSILTLRDGSVFALVRHDWVCAEARAAFFDALKLDSEVGGQRTEVSH